MVGLEIVDENHLKMFLNNDYGDVTFIEYKLKALFDNNQLLYFLPFIIILIIYLSPIL